MQLNWISTRTFNKNLARLSLKQGKGEIQSPIPHYNEPIAEFLVPFPGFHITKPDALDEESKISL